MGLDFTFTDLAMVMAYMPEFFDDDELLLIMLYIVESEAAEVPRHLQYERFDLNRFSDNEAKYYFRFDTATIRAMVNLLGIPDDGLCYQGSLWNGVEGLCMMLRRMSYPNRLFDLVQMFGRSEPELSMIINQMLLMVHNNNQHRLQTLQQPWVDFDDMAAAVHGTGAPDQHVWGFIDGTVLGIARPTVGQESVFNGHKRKHALKFQSVMLPNGIMLHFSGPQPGRRHDSYMYYQSGLEDLLPHIMSANGDQLAIYGDQAYTPQPFLHTPFKGAAVTPDELEYNADMSKVRVCVEWGFAKIQQFFAYCNYAKGMRALQMPVGQYYLVAALLANLHTCCYGSQTGDFFGCAPPSMIDYMR